MIINKTYTLPKLKKNNVNININTAPHLDIESYGKPDLVFREL